MAKEIPKPEGWGELDPNIAKSSPRDFAKPLLLYSIAPPIAFVPERGSQ